MSIYTYRVNICKKIEQDFFLHCTITGNDNITIVYYYYYLLLLFYDYYVLYCRYVEFIIIFYLSFVY